MRGRYCVKSSDGWWLVLNRATGATWFIRDPAPPEPATSFFGKVEAAEALERDGLPTVEVVRVRLGFASVEEMKAAGFPERCWAVVPDPNP